MDIITRPFTQHLPGHLHPRTAYTAVPLLLHPPSCPLSSNFLSPVPSLPECSFIAQGPAPLHPFNHSLPPLFMYSSPSPWAPQSPFMAQPVEGLPVLCSGLELGAEHGSGRAAVSVEGPCGAVWAGAGGDTHGSRAESRGWSKGGKGKPWSWGLWGRRAGIPLERREARGQAEWRWWPGQWLAGGRLGPWHVEGAWASDP